MDETIVNQSQGLDKMSKNYVVEFGGVSALAANAAQSPVANTIPNE